MSSDLISKNNLSEVLWKARHEIRNNPIARDTDTVVKRLEKYKDECQLKFLLSVSDPFQKDLEIRLGMYLAFKKAIEIVKGDAE